MDNYEYKLIYFNTRGICEPIRFILSIGKASFNEVRFPKDELWPKLSEEIKSTLPWGNCPVLELKDGRVISQSTSIARYLARKYGLVGRTKFEEAKCDEVVDAAVELLSHSYSIRFDEDDNDKETLKDSTKQMLNSINRNLQENNGPWFVGDDFTWADIYVAYAVKQSESVLNIPFLSEENTDLTPLKKLIANVYSIPEIQEWIRTSPPTEL